MSTNHQPRKFSYARSLRFIPARLLLTAVLLAGLIGCNTVDGMDSEADAFTESVQTAQKDVNPSLRLGDIENSTSRSTGFKTEAAVPLDSSTTLNAADCFKWEYINGEWTLVLIPCPEYSSNTLNAGDCYEWQYINGEWTLVRIECPE